MVAYNSRGPGFESGHRQLLLNIYLLLANLEKMKIKKRGREWPNFLKKNNFNTNILSGQAVGGIFPALVDVFVTLVRVREQDVGFACFTIATVVLVIGILGKSSPSFQKFAF